MSQSPPPMILNGRPLTSCKAIYSHQPPSLWKRLELRDVQDNLLSARATTLTLPFAKSFGDRAYSYHSPRLCNALPALCWVYTCIPPSPKVLVQICHLPGPLPGRGLGLRLRFLQGLSIGRFKRESSTFAFSKDLVILLIFWGSRPKFEYHFVNKVNVRFPRFEWKCVVEVVFSVKICANI